MSEPYVPTGSPSGDRGEGEATVFGLVSMLGQYRRLILGLPVAASLLALIVTFLVPKTFTATTRILPPQQGQSSATALLSQLGGLGALAGLAGGPALKSPSDLFVGMLKSDAVTDKLVERFDLKSYYSEPILADARRELLANSRFRSEKSGIIVIDVDAKNPVLASDLANAFVAELQRLTGKLAITDAAQRRAFFEEHLKESKAKLAVAEVELRQAIQSSGLVSVDAQSRATVEVVAKLRAQLSAKEIQIRAMSAYASPSNPDLRRAQDELASMKQELLRLESGVPAQPSGSGSTSEGAAEGLSTIQVLREVKYQEVMFELLAKQYEMARLEESREAPLIQVMDVAVPPEKRSHPRRTLIVVLAFIGASMASVSFALAHHQLSQPWYRAQLLRIKRSWTGRS